MNIEQIMKSDVLDILFEKRNKQYGAYVLRKFYNDRLLKSVIIMLAFAIVASAFTFLPKKEMNGGFVVTEILEMGKAREIAKPKPIEIKPNVKPETTAPQTVAKTNKFISNIVITKTTITDVLPTDLDESAIGTVTNPGNQGGTIPAKDTGTGLQKTVEVVKPVDINIPVDVAEVMPSFPGGNEAFRKFLQKNLVNPSEMNEGEQVTVKVRFVVGYDGKLKGFTIVQDGGDEFNDEVIRVVKKMPQWVPGKSNGQNVSVYITIPVKFVGSN